MDYQSPELKLDYTPVEADIDTVLPFFAPHLTLTDDESEFNRVGWKERISTMEARGESGDALKNSREYEHYLYRLAGKNTHKEGDFDRGSDFKRYQLPRVIAYLLGEKGPLQHHPRERGLKMAVLCHDESFALELAVILTLVNIGFRIESVSCYNPWCDLDKLRSHLQMHMETIDPEMRVLGDHIHFFNKSSLEQFYAQTDQGLDFIWGLNCALPGPILTPGKSAGFIQVCDFYYYLQKLSYPGMSISDTYKSTTPRTPSYSFVCDQTGYYGKLRPPTNIMYTHITRPQYQLVIAEKSDMVTRVVFPDQRPDRLTDLELKAFFTNPYLKLNQPNKLHQPNIRRVFFQKNITVDWLRDWYIANIGDI